MSRYTRLLSIFFSRLVPTRTAIVKAFTVIFSIGLIVGCSARNVTYYQYALVPAPASLEVEVGGELPATLGVFPVNVPGWLDKKNITWSDGGVRLHTFDNDHWGEPLPNLLTQAMVQNLRLQLGTGSWVSSGPWIRGNRPAVVVFASVQSIAVVNHQLQMTVAWTMEGQERQVIDQRERVYALVLDSGDSRQSFVETLSRVWGLVAKDMTQAFVDTENAQDKAS